MAQISDVLLVHLEHVSAQLRMTTVELQHLLRGLHDVMVDQSFVNQVLAINDDIVLMSADN